MPFLSILCTESERGIVAEQEPAFFADLNLDQVIAFITAGREEYNLAPFFYTPLHDADAISYRHEVMRELRNETLLAQIRSFAQSMQSMRSHLSQAKQLHYTHQKQSWFLDAVTIYSDAVLALVRDLSLTDLGSRGFLGFRDYLTDYARSGGFIALVAETNQLKEQLSGIRYCLNILDNQVKVSKYDSEPDYGSEVAATFEKFRQGAVKDYRAKFPARPDMNHVEAAVLALVAQLHPEIFAALTDFCGRYRGYLDPAVGAFDREVQFYVAYLEFVARFDPARLTFCYPQVSASSKEILGQATFDVALASKLLSEPGSVVCNDFYLQDPERIFVVSGPNQGGKTTFARTLGQLHYLASIGCLVPGSQARLFLVDQLFTHFERGENLTDLSGKLQDDLIRIHEILERATASSMIIMNEIFTSTVLTDAISLGTKMLQEIIALDALCVCVTFVDELASLSESTVSMVAAVPADSPAMRTYRLDRRPADGLAYAMAIAEKYGLSYERLKNRIAS